MDNRAGFWCALVATVFGIAYMGAVVAVLASGTPLPPVAPYDTIISLISFFAAPILIVLWTVLHTTTPADRRIFSLASLAFVVVFATMTSINRYVGLVMVPQSRAAGVTDGLHWFLPYGWPSMMAAIEMLGWSFYLGLAWILLSFAYRAGPLARALRIVSAATGVLCMTAALGQITGQMGFTMLGLLGWGPGMTTAFVLMALRFHVATKTTKNQ